MQQTKANIRANARRLQQVSRLVTIALRWLAGFSILSACMTVPIRAQGLGVSGVMEKLNKDEQQLITDTLKEQIPQIVLKEEDRALAETLVKDGKKINKFARQIAQGDYSGVNGALAEATKDQLAAQIELRYPDPDSPMRRVLASVKNNPDTYKKLAAAALNADPYMAKKALRDAIQEHAKKNLAGLLDEGKTFWKDLFDDVVPGSDRFRRYGASPAEIYLQGLEDWTDFVRQTGDRYHRSVLNCYHSQYRRFRSQGASEFEAKRDIADLQLSNAKCGSENGGGSVAQDVVGWAKNRFGGAATLGKLNLDPADLAVLLEQFERERGNSSGSSFADWMAARFNRNLRQRQTQLRKTIGAEQKAAATKQSEALRRVVELLRKELPNILRSALGEERLSELSSIPVADHLPEDEVKPFAKPSAEDEKKEKEKKQQQAVKDAQRELECNPDYQANPKANLGDGFVAVETADKGPDFVDKEGCRPYGPAAKRFDYEVPAKPQDPSHEEAREPDRCAQLSALLDAAKSDYGAGRIEPAKKAVYKVTAAIADLPRSEECLDVQRRAFSNAEKISRMAAVIASVRDALDHCEPQVLERQALSLEGKRNNKLVELRNRTLRARPVAELYTRAKASYHAGDIGRSETLFEEALNTALEIEGGTCENIGDRIHRNLRRISQLREFDEAARSAIGNCDMGRVTDLMGKLEGSTNPFLGNAYNRLKNIPVSCRQKLGDSACQKDFGRFAVADIEQSTERSYSCQCRSGYRWKPNARSGSNACITVVESERLGRDAMNAQCRKQHGSGYYAGPANKKGLFYCRPTKKTANAWCRRNNKGSGWYAGKITSKGSFSCYSRNRATATRRRPKRRKVHRRRVRQQQGYDPRAAAAAATIILQGVQAYQRAKRGRRGHGGGGGCANPRAPGC